MPRYVKQPDTFSCGPIAVINALKWAGKDCTMQSDLKRLQESMQCTYKRGGTRRTYLEQTLRREARGLFRVRKKIGPSIKEIESHIHGGGSVLLLFAYKNAEGEMEEHYMLVVDALSSGNVFLCLNTSLNRFRTLRALVWKPRKVIRYCLRTRMYGNTKYPAAWFLTKIE